MADKKIDIVFVSPLRRALETCWEIFKDHPSKPQIIVDPLFKEILESSCDVGNRL
jgi:broad specificity phosphatase PhoE